MPSAFGHYCGDLCTAVFANALLRRWMVPTIGLILLLLSAIVLGLVYPGAAIQYFSVRPDGPDKERSYIKANSKPPEPRTEWTK